MGNKYVSLSGNNANNGLGPDASDSTNKPWATIDYAIDAMDDGDVLYIAPGIYRESVSPAENPASARTLRGDPQNSQSFKDGSGVLIAPGPVIVTNLRTDDVTASTNAVIINTNGKDYLTFENLWIEGLSASNAVTIGSGSEHIVFRNCYIIGVVTAVSITVAVDTNADILIENCTILAVQSMCADVILTKSNTADYSSGVTIRNCVLLATYICVLVQPTATATYFGGNVNVQNCNMFAEYGVRASSGYNAALESGKKIYVKNCVVIAETGVSQVAAGDSNAVVEDYNLLLSYTPRSNVTAGGNSIAYSSSTFARALRLEMGQSELFGFMKKSFMAPWSTSRSVGFGNDSTPTALTSDMFGRVKPSGSGIVAGNTSLGVGAIELHDYGTKDTAVKDAGDASIRLKGPGDHDLWIPVAAESTTISIKVQYDNAGDNDYGGTDYPQAILIDNEGFAGISGNTETETATVSAAGAWETLTFTAFTPSRKGVVKLRLKSRDTNGDGYCYFDTVGIT